MRRSWQRLRLHGLASTHGCGRDIGVQGEEWEERAVNEYMTSAEVARWLRVDKSTVCRWRMSGMGPRVTWVSPSLPRYARSDVEEWLAGVAA